MGAEVVQAHDTANDSLKSDGQQHRSRIGDVLFTIDVVPVDLGSKSGLHLSRCATEDHGVATVPDGQNMEALRSKPGGNLSHVILTCAEAIAKFPCRKPFVVVGRGVILLLGEQEVQRLLLVGRGSQKHVDIADLERRLDRTLVKFWLRLQMQTLGQHDGGTGPDGTGDAVGGGGVGCGGEDGGAENRRRGKRRNPSTNNAHANSWIKGFWDLNRFY